MSEATVRAFFTTDHAMGYSQCARLGDHDADLGHVLDGPLEALAPEARNSLTPRYGMEKMAPQVLERDELSEFRT